MLKFKKLSVYGFKSFADKLEIKFGEGITGIVGPNGCGKSNVADAMRWVLGEQSAKTLRGSSMQDIIFNGTNKRKSMSYAEVSLVFNNENRELFPSCPYEEVVITRKLLRQGESGYFINRTPSKLKDIVALLRDGRFGREGYTIIGQGKIDELLNSKPEGRRAIFEDAAGISKFRAEKAESERKLKHTDDKLLIVNNLLQQRADMLAPITKQAELARKYIVLRDELKKNEINVYLAKYENLNDELEEGNRKLAEVIAQLNDALKEQADNAATCDKAMEEQNSLDATLESYRSELLALTVGMQKNEGDIQLINERIKHYDATNSELLKENETLSTEQEQCTRLYDEKMTERSGLQERLDVMLGEYNAQLYKHNQTSSNLTQRQREIEDARNSIASDKDKLSDLKSNLSALNGELETRNKHAVSIDDRLKDASERIEVAKNLLSVAQNELDALAYDKNALLQSLEKICAERDAANSQLEKVKSELAVLNEKYITGNSRFKTLSELSSSYEGYANSSKLLLKDAETNPQISNKICDVVGKIFSVDEKFEIAIETALGGSVSYIVTNNDADARDLIEYLKTKRYGRCTFLPINTVKTRSLDDKYKDLLQYPGCFGAAENLVRFDSKYLNIARALLGNTLIVDNIDTARQISKKCNYNVRLVTLEGDIVNTNGYFTGGSRRSELGNVFSREREISELTAALEKMSDSINELNINKVELANKLVNLNAQSNTKMNAIHEFDVKLATKQEACNKQKEIIVQAEHEKGAIEQERGLNQQRVNTIIETINSISELEQSISIKCSEADVSGKEFEKEYNELREEIDRINRELVSLQMKVLETKNEIAALDNEIGRLKSQADSALSKIEYNNTKIVANNSLIDEQNELLQSISQQSSGVDSVRCEELKEKLSDLAKFKSDIQENLAAANVKRADIANRINELTAIKYTRELDNSRKSDDLNAMQQHILEEYQLDYQGCLEFKEEDFDVIKGYNECSRLKNSMNRMGSPNLAAIDQAQELYQEYENDVKQRDDLTAAKVGLEQIISETSKKMTKIFNEQFTIIKKNFVEIFKELFRGGTADLILMENEDPLNAGIEIVAQPPEKNLQSISLLSGGEKAMTAIAILFAILRLKPMPFCVLDEIEAALDDANAARFAAYLKKFSKETQFIVITHRKPTMEEADCLYGVTMEEKGVTKIVSVKLEDAEKFDSSGASA